MIAGLSLSQKPVVRIMSLSAQAFHSFTEYKRITRKFLGMDNRPSVLLPHEVRAEKLQALFDNAHPVVKAVFLWRAGVAYDDKLAQSLFKQTATLTQRA